MKKVAFIICVFSGVLFFSGCNDTALSNDISFLNATDEQITVLFSDSKQIKKEDNYYEAFLELQGDNPDTVEPFIIIDKEDRKYIRYFNVDTFPTMIVLEGDYEQLRLEGPLSKDKILHSLKEVIQQRAKSDIKLLISQ
ncbi:hypothetical protein [Alkalihalobacillus trypoxylicola]|uniref:Thioredoxin domain-containing protein n=1 Tax=Alkalihalobacillus trypoxylicola TaxID=519424 RepID=A0A162FBP0_9BACI|nr:hypothetical protein [Alkalihalobacillus trypoxylicola]KYG35229.1 hypothetical protein AZF04_02505 [Alkalihalobacillus trypoxylicola]GAF63915.1 hypothetical protein BTS2_0807 [Bacillus sp. TS-2]